jgi:hypothetical protein
MARLGRIAMLRVTFVGLAVLLLVPLGFLHRVVRDRVDEQKRLRHQVVAERIFDELERELTRLLEKESARPTEAYDLATDSDTWAPFVVGYFTSDVRGRRLVTRSSLAEERHRELEAWISAHLAVPPAPAAPAKAPAPEVSSAPPSPAEPRSSPEILRNLNVGSQRRPSAPSQPKSEKRDPLMDYGF